MLRAIAEAMIRGRNKEEGTLEGTRRQRHPGGILQPTGHDDDEAHRPGGVAQQLVHVIHHRLHDLGDEGGIGLEATAARSEREEVPHRAEAPIRERERRRVRSAGAVERSSEALEPHVEPRAEDVEGLLAQGHLESVTEHRVIPRQHAVHELVEIRLGNADDAAACARRIAADAAPAGRRHQEAELLVVAVVELEQLLAAAEQREVHAVTVRTHLHGVPRHLLLQEGRPLPLLTAARSCSAPHRLLLLKLDSLPSPIAHAFGSPILDGAVAASAIILVATLIGAVTLAAAARDADIPNRDRRRRRQRRRERPELRRGPRRRQSQGRRDVRGGGRVAPPPHQIGDAPGVHVAGSGKDLVRRGRRRRGRSGLRV